MVALRDDTATARTIALQVADWPGHVGEVSPYLTDVLRVGDQLELRGPIGGHFVWDVTLVGPLLLVGGASGMVPLMAMLRHRAAATAAEAHARHKTPARVLYSSRRWDDVIYREELARLAQDDETLEVALALTRQQPEGWTGFRRNTERFGPTGGSG